MKKQLLLFAFSTLALTSCNDDNLAAYEMDIMKGDWKEVKTEIISGKDNKTVLETTTPEGCSAKNTLFFRTDYYVSYTAYDGDADGTNCQLAAKNEGKYTYDTDSKVLNIQLKGEDNELGNMSFRVDMLTQTEFRLAQLVGNYDKDGDKIIDVTYITYKDKLKLPLIGSFLLLLSQILKLNIMKKLLSVFLLLCFTIVFSQEKKPMFWHDIQEFKKQDQQNPPPQNAILLIGSSSFTKWTDVADYFPTKTIINRGFGGSRLLDLNYFADDLLAPYQPKQIIIYCGENDFADNPS